MPRVGSPCARRRAPSYDSEGHVAQADPRVEVLGEISSVARPVVRTLGDNNGHATPQERVSQCRRSAAGERPGGILGLWFADREHLEDQVEVDDGNANVPVPELTSKPARNRALAAGNRPGNHDHHAFSMRLGLTGSPGLGQHRAAGTRVPAGHVSGGQRGRPIWERLKSAVRTAEIHEILAEAR